LIGFLWRSSAFALSNVEWASAYVKTSARQVGGTGKVYESENDGEIENSTSIHHSLFAFSLRQDLLLGRA